VLKQPLRNAIQNVRAIDRSKHSHRIRAMKVMIEVTLLGYP